METSWVYAPPRVVETQRGAVELADFGAGDAVLCLHGAMGGYDQGLLLGAVLGEPGYRYVCPSRPGYLGTPLARGRTPEEQADLYAALLDALGIEGTAVMAVSGGGPSAVHLALRHRDRLAALVLVSCPAQPTANRPPLRFRLFPLLLRLPGFARSLERKAAEEPEAMAARSITDPELLARTIRNADAWTLLRQLQTSTMTRMRERLEGTFADAAVAAERTYPLEQVQVPTLVVHGTHDPGLPIDRHGEVSAARIPGAQLLPLAGGGHAAIFSHRDEARARTTAFLRAALRRPSPEPAGMRSQAGPA
jgi:pimeloyl-ACP methyl ester carboxylesterase